MQGGMYVRRGTNMAETMPFCSFMANIVIVWNGTACKGRKIACPIGHIFGLHIKIEIQYLYISIENSTFAAHFVISGRIGCLRILRTITF